MDVEQRLVDDAKSFAKDVASLDEKGFTNRTLAHLGILTDASGTRPVKQVIVIRRDLGMRRGKEIAQGAHASMAWLAGRLEFPASGSPDPVGARFSDAELTWLESGFRKITCQVSSEEEILALKAEADRLDIEAHVITDSGLTEFGGVPTVTAAAFGPDWDDVVDRVTGSLRLY